MGLQPPKANPETTDHSHPWVDLSYQLQGLPCEICHRPVQADNWVWRTDDWHRRVEVAHRSCVKAIT